MIENNAFLFGWNPENFSFKDELYPKINELKFTGRATVEWSVQSSKTNIGDRAFIIKLGGGKVKGIFASGTIVSNAHPILHWSKRKQVPGVTIEFDVLLNSEKVKILDIKDLKYLSKDQQWTPRRSGILIKENDKLEKEWYNFLNNNNLFSFINDKQTFIEGAAYQITQTFYERSSYARKVCLNYYGYSCVVCGFNFKDKYGEIGEGYIHVHHLKQLSIAKGNITDPVRDLRPVCPNCHAMLHRVNPPYTLEELKQLLLSSKK